uniref:Aminotransferase-like plant mobile domain-containing protein n=1 Tax=Chenopodium quinoa TaxID=63459 RepID=A0A803MJM3_CHEQI
MTRVRSDGILTIGDGEVLPLDPNQVYLILGVPMGKRPIPRGVDMECVEESEKVNRIVNRYGVGPKKETISSVEASKALCPVDSSSNLMKLQSEEDKEEFMTTFLLVALGKILCTTINSSNLAVSLVHALTVATQANEYDWCSFTFDWLKDTSLRFQRRFEKNGFRSGCGGSIVFVLIFYLDHLEHIPLKWGVFLRLKVWSTNQVKAVVFKDRLSKDEDEYGRLLAIDVAYGEPHPLVPRDRRGESASGVVDNSRMSSSSVVSTLAD